MKKNLLTIGTCLLGVVAMTGCASKCTFKEFQDAVKEVETHEFKTCKVKGTYKAYDKESDEKEEYKLNEGLTYQSSSVLGVDLGGMWMTEDDTEEAGLAMGLMLVYSSVASLALYEAENTTYYAGSTFKVVEKVDEDGISGKATLTFNKYGLLTSLKISEKDDDGSYAKINVTVSYKK